MPTGVCAAVVIKCPVSASLHKNNHCPACVLCLVRFLIATNKGPNRLSTLAADNWLLGKIQPDMIEYSE